MEPILISEPCVPVNAQEAGIVAGWFADIYYGDVATVKQNAQAFLREYPKIATCPLDELDREPVVIEVEETSWHADSDTDIPCPDPNCPCRTGTQIIEDIVREESDNSANRSYAR